MASNVLYPSGSQHMLAGNIHLSQSAAGLLSSSFCALVSSSYTYSGAHEFYTSSNSALPGAHAVVSQSLANVTCTTGTLDADNLTYSSVAAGSTITHVIIFQSGSKGVNDYLIAHYDTGSEGGVSIVTNGGDIAINWNANGLLSLSSSC